MDKASPARPPPMIQASYFVSSIIFVRDQVPEGPLPMDRNMPYTDSIKNLSPFFFDEPPCNRKRGIIFYQVGSGKKPGDPFDTVISKWMPVQVIDQKTF